MVETVISQFYSQFEQDRFVYERFFRQKHHGLFVEIGADDGVAKSNTLFFEKALGWHGLCVEPRPKAFEALVRNRRCHCENVAIAGHSGQAEFLEISGWGKGLSGLVKFYDAAHIRRIRQELQTEQGRESRTQVIQVATVRLEDLLLKYGYQHIDFCSIDTEGSELDIVKSIDFNQFTFDVLTIENNYNRPEVREYMEKAGFRLFDKINVDDVFVREVLFRSFIPPTAIDRRTEKGPTSCEIKAMDHPLCNQTKSTRLSILNAEHAASVLEMAVAHHQLGEKYHALGNKEQALLHLEKAVTIAPANCRYLKCLADYYYVAIKRMDRAMELYAKVIELNPGDIDSLMMLGHIKIAHRHYDDAAYYYSRVLDFEADHAEALRFQQMLNRRKAASRQPGPADISIR